MSAVHPADQPVLLSGGAGSLAGQVWRGQLLRLGLALLATLLTVLLRLPELDRYATIDESRWVSRAADFSAYLQGRDLFVVLEGELTFRVGFSEHRLGPGDSMSFADFQPHQLRNEGDTEARAIICVVGDDEGHRPAGS